MIRYRASVVGWIWRLDLNGCVIIGREATRQAAFTAALDARKLATP